MPVAIVCLSLSLFELGCWTTSFLSGDQRRIYVLMLCVQTAAKRSGFFRFHSSVFKCSGITAIFQMLSFHCHGTNVAGILTDGTFHSQVFLSYSWKLRDERSGWFHVLDYELSSCVPSKSLCNRVRPSLKALCVWTSNGHGACSVTVHQTSEPVLSLDVFFPRNATPVYLICFTCKAYCFAQVTGFNHIRFNHQVKHS